MSKIKMRCIACGKWFQSANAKEVTCPDCVQKARKEKMATKNTPPIASKPSSGPIASNPVRPGLPPKPKPTQSGTSHWLDTLNDVKVGQPDQPQRPKMSPPPAPRDNRGTQGGHGGFRDPNNYRDDRGSGSYRESGNRGPGNYRDRGYEQRGPGGYRVGGGSGLPETAGPRLRYPTDGGFDRGPRQDKPRFGGPREGSSHKPKPSPKPKSPPKPKHEKIPPPPPFLPTPEQITQVETRYLELSTPNEFDGIRTQIAKELEIPKKAVKKIIKDLRDRQNIPSWWERQTYKGDTEELERIKAAYEPLLPVPPVGVHKKISDELGLKPAVVYQAIKLIRLEMNLPQYNDPTLHGQELAQQAQNEHLSAPEESSPQASPVPPVEETTERAVSSASALEPKNSITES